MNESVGLISRTDQDLTTSTAGFMRQILNIFMSSYSYVENYFSKENILIKGEIND